MCIKAAVLGGLASLVEVVKGRTRAAVSPAEAASAAVGGDALAVST